MRELNILATHPHLSDPELMLEKPFKDWKDTLSAVFEKQVIMDQTTPLADMCFWDFIT